MAGVDAPDKDKPVARDEHARRERAADQRGLAESRGDIAPAAEPGEEDGDGDERPDVAVRDELKGIDAGEVFPKKRKQPPAKVGPEGGEGAASVKR